LRHVLGAALPYLTVGITDLHVGIGRSPGSVDLPVARDAFGLPYLPASALKGAVKALCLRLESGNPYRCERLYGWDIRVRGDAPEEAWMSPVAFTDGLLFLYPARVDTGSGSRFAYVTSRLQLSRILSVLGGNCCLADAVRAIIDEAGGAGSHGGESLLVNNVPVDGVIELNDESFLYRLSRRLMGLDQVPLPGLLLRSGIYVVEDNADFIQVVEAGIVRHTRVALDYRRKTVQSGHLWSEEYVPQGAVFASMLVFSGGIPGAASATEACRSHLSLLDRVKGVLQVGGKETIGKGFVKILTSVEVGGQCR